ncbi:MAG: carboxypeptidase regulatory-like domain-containing protein, partial [Atribacterota bacterium]|nr:carboxypeptidase regulatory-like domain-containing protein [Atribacterota bacterium]
TPPSEGEEEESSGESTGRVVLMELFNVEGCAASKALNPLVEEVAEEYSTDEVILVELKGWLKGSTPETEERFDWYIPEDKHTPFIAFNGLSDTFSEGISGGGGGGGGGSPGTTVKIPETTKVANEETEDQLIDVSPDHSSVTFAQTTTQLEELQPGDVLVMGITPQTPYGLLRKVVSVSRSRQSSEVSVQTEPAKLEDAVEQGDFEMTKSLSPDEVSRSVSHVQGVRSLAGTSRSPGIYDFEYSLDALLYDGDDDPDTKYDNIEATGLLSFDYDIIFDGEIRWFKLQSLVFKNVVNIEENIEVTVGGNLASFDESYELFTLYFAPIPVPLGPVVIYLTPQIDLIIGIEGNIYAQVTTDVTQTNTFTAGIELANGQWQPIASYDPAFDYNEPTLSAGADVKAYAGPQLECMIINLAGPHCNIFGYLDLHANTSEIPWWILNAGLEVSAGIEVEALTYHWTSPEYTLIDLCTDPPLAQAGGGSSNGYISGKVIDAVVDDAIQGVSVEAYNGDELIYSDLTDSSGDYYLTVPPGLYKVKFIKTGYITAIHENVLVEEGITNYLQTILQIDENYSGEGNINGTISNALNGNGVSGISIGLREGLNVTTGTVITSTLTGNEGYYEFSNLNAGYYTAEASGTGYNTTYFTVICIGGTTTENQDATITPNVSEEQTRFVLRWGESPYDLDSHLTGPTSEDSRFHVYWANKTYTYSGITYADLDRDDTNSFGPETTTIYQQIPGVYRFSVHDYSNRNSDNSFALANSGAYVQVYSGSELIATYNVPSNQDGTLWTVCEIDGNTMTPINEMSYESSYSDIRQISSSDAELMIDLPTKK